MGVFSKKPFRVKMRGVNVLEYSEGDKQLTLEGERLAPNEGASLIYWFLPKHTWSRPSGIQVTHDEKHKIKFAVEKHFEERGTKVEVEIM